MSKLSAYLGKVALIGRVNVGKSSLFNTLSQSEVIVSPIPGATRDRVYGRCELGDGLWCEVIDCGGYAGMAEADFWQQSIKAIDEAKLTLFLLDGRSGFHPMDGELGLYLRRSGAEALYLITKQDRHDRQALNAGEFYNKMPYMTELIPVSATTGLGIKELKAHLKESLQKVKRKSTAHQKEVDRSSLFTACLVGKPNSGKSSLLNTLVSEERSCVSAEAGTTRDPVGVQVRFFQNSYRILDTAGVRRRTKVSGQLEKKSVTLSLKAIRESHLTLLIIDAQVGLTDQDAKIIRVAQKAFKPLVIVVSKWDLVKNQEPYQQKTTIQNMRRAHLANMPDTPIRFVSSVTKYGVSKLYAEMEKMVDMASKRVSTASANQALAAVVARRTPHLISSFQKRIKFYYITQVTVHPPTFVIKCNVADALRVSYRRYLEKALAKELGFHSIPLRFFYRSKGEEKPTSGKS